MAPAGQDERKKLIAGVRRRLKSDGAGQDLGELAGALFSNANIEDLQAYSNAENAWFVKSAGELIARRPAGKHILRLTNPDIDGRAHQHRSITLVEVLNDNMPFLVDSIIGELEAFGVEIKFVAHPIIMVKRAARGELTTFIGSATSKPPANAMRESLIQIHVSRLSGEADRNALQEKLDGLLVEVRRVVTDWRTMRERVEKAIDDYRFGHAGFSDEHRDEAIAFLKWLLDDNFTLLGIREYDFVGGKARGELKRRDGPGLGILGNPKVRVLRRGDQAYTATPATRAFLMRPEPLFVTKANIKSRVHRRAYMDYVGAKLHDKIGRLTGELRIIGLFTSTAYNRSTRVIPYLRRKTERVLALAGFEPDAHSGKALFNVLESYPRDELFHIDDQTLYDFSLAILELYERPRIRVLVRPDEFDRYVSVIVFVPRDRYNTAIRIAIGDYLAEQFDGHVSAFYPAYPEATVLARVHFIIGRDEGKAPVYDEAMLEAGVADIVRTWSDSLRLHFARSERGGAAGVGKRKYEAAFPVAYREVFDPDVAIGDIDTFERLTDDEPLAAEFHELEDAEPDEVGLKLFHRAKPLSLSQRVPILENMGFRVIAEQTFEIVPAGGAAEIHVHDMALRRADGSPVGLEQVKQALTDCLLAVWHRRAEDDGYNGLVLIAGLAWRDAALIRALGHFLHQAGTPYSQRSIWEALQRYPEIARLIVTLFHTRFDPDGLDDIAAESAQQSIINALAEVETLEDDTIVRRLVNVLAAMLRTNFFQRTGDGQPKSEIVFKFDSRQVDSLPKPRPFREIFVHAPRVEGVHLRFGEIARGGLRWSDRAQDFRTEILGLVKAQQVKNAVIVPVGAKGGFVAKWLRPGATREEFLAEGEATYRIFVSSMLDITDNLDGGAIVPPPMVVRRDGDDPYLVVAADKGTATFSDIANAIAVKRGFWLGDAFASGGSAGYDHKKMGITARGAWESVKRHFREMNIDIQTTPFTVAGVGDMSGDVFGNGMLLSPAIRLVAAFDHRDIFIDPDPDPKIALAERRRLFEMQRSSWQDYDRDLISKGGGIFSRRKKSLQIGREIQELLGLTASRATPQEVMRAILGAKVDLLWFGGVGTFVKGPNERDEDVGDRSNDAIRITADEVKARVIGEGANLGLTQRARIAYGLAGGRCNSDAIDNSAGVNTSDIEVNIKIALGAAVRAGRLTIARRNRVLKAMTNEVAQLALTNNYAQTLAISLTERRGLKGSDFQQRLMQALERRGLLDRSVEILPDDAAMDERQAAGQPLTRAEIGVLLAYAKITIFDDLLAGDVADDPSFSNELMRYFPSRMRAEFANEIKGHRLRREIVITNLSNSMVNRCGATFVRQMADRTGAGPSAIARAYVAVREAFSLRDFHGRVDALDNRLQREVQLSLYQEARDLVHGRTVWFLENASFSGGVGATIDMFRPAVEGIKADLDGVLPTRLAEVIARKTEAFVASGVPEDLAKATAKLPVLASALDICVAATAAGAALLPTATIFFEIGERFRIARIEQLARRLSLTDYYDDMALERALEGLARVHRELTKGVLSLGTRPDAIDRWLTDAGAGAPRTLEAIAGMTESEELTVSRVSVAAGLLADFARDRGL